MESEITNGKNMKILVKILIKYTLIIITAGWLLHFSSCSNRFLEQPTGTVITVDSIFNSPDKAMKALNNVYATCIVNGFLTGDGGSGLSDAGAVDRLLAGCSDEADALSGRPDAFNKGTWGPTNLDEFSMSRVIQGMRNACLFIDNAGNVPYITTGVYTWTEQLKNQTIAEAKFLRALMHFEMMKRFVGIPIMTQVPKVVLQEIDGLNKAVVIPSAYRQSLKSTVNFIVKSCDEAAQNLPNTYPATELGRATKGVALALKARTLLYAASPLYNTATPAVSLTGKDSLICMGDYKAERWIEAATANKAVLDWALANGYALLDDASLGKRESYNYATGAVLDSRNKEIIYFDHSHGQQAGGCNLIRFVCPIYYSWGGCVQAIPMNFVNYYRDINGNDLIIPTDGTFPQMKQLCNLLEPRFHASIWTPGKQYTYTGLMNTAGGADTAKFLYRKGGITGAFQMTGAGTALIGIGVPNGFHFKKFINLVNANNGTVNSYWPIFRLAEFYLNYAEALNETNTSSNEIITSLNSIRVRGGLPILAPGNTTYNACFGNKDKMRQYIQRERAIELYAEEHRYFDILRWKIAGNDGIQQGNFNKISLYENGTGTYIVPTTSMTQAQRVQNDNRLSFKIEYFETRVWSEKMYWFPFPQSEVSKGFLVQNPGW